MTTNSAPPTATASLRYLVGSVGQQSLAFPESWVSNIVAVERAQVLPLPFYSPGVVGIIAHQGKMMPLLSARAFYSELPPLNWNQPTLMAVRLGKSLPELAGVGVTVERIVHSVTASQLTTERIVNLSKLPVSLWQPQRWYLNN